MVDAAVYRKGVIDLLARQTEDTTIGKMQYVDGPDKAGICRVRTGHLTESMTFPQILERFDFRESWIAGAEGDHYNLGIWFPAWHGVMWEIAKLRVENPGVPIEYMLAGANGSAKTFLAAAMMICAMEQTKDMPFLCFAINEQNSVAIEQKALHYWLPNEYKTDTGRTKTTSKVKLGYNPSGGFTANCFALQSGATMECRFWSMDLGTLQGLRPYAVWSDEGLPIQWMKDIYDRLLTKAELSSRDIPMWKDMLEQRELNPTLPFPRDKIGALLRGVHILSYTFRDGWTETVQAFEGDGSKVMAEIEADPELLPVRNKRGDVIGGEKIPTLVYSKTKTRRMSRLFAWDNPKGGNWAGMRKVALTKSRQDILWQCYGVAERIADSPFPNFNDQAHVRPISWLPRSGTWYCVFDPVSSGGRCWFGLWAIVAGEQSFGISPGDIFVVHEYPQQSDYIPGFGDVGPWALPGGKSGLRGPAQKSWSVGFEWRASEIRRVEAKLAEAMNRANGKTAWDVENKEQMDGFIVHGNRIMDSRAGNTVNENQGGGKTLIQYMEDNDLYFTAAGRDSGAAQGQTKIHPGEQMINDHLYYDRTLSQIDPATGYVFIDPQKGRGPRLWICDQCTNLIDSIRHYPGVMNASDSPFKDPIDCLRYLLIAEPLYLGKMQLVSGGGSY